MSTTSHFCTQCGTTLADDARFCGNCGQSTPAPALVGAVEEAATVEMGASNGHGNGAGTLPPPAQTEAPRLVRPAVAPPAPPVTDPSSSSSPWPWIAGVVGLLIVGGVVVAIVLAGGGKSASGKTASSDTSFRRQVAHIFGPVLGTNQHLSRALERLRGTDPVAARADVREAQDATTAAQGALGALTVPNGSVQLDTAARQVLDREVAYLGAVSNVLHQPSPTATAQLQTLASNLTSALSAAGPTVAGSTPTVEGVNKLVAWAPKAGRQRHKAAAKKKSGGSSAHSSSGGGSSAAPSNPYASGRDCGDGVFAGPNTSCSFADNTRDAYDEAPGSTASVEVFSPVTNQTYTMNCAPSGNGITCSGGNSASVTF